MYLVRKNFTAIPAGITVMAFTFAGCASSPKNSSYPAGADAHTEIGLIDQQMASARLNQVDVLSPVHFKEAESHLSKARKDSDKDHNNADALGELSTAKTALDAANNVANTAQREIPEVISARKDALQANASKQSGEQLRKTDEQFMDFTKDLEKGQMKISADDRNELSRNYLNIELMAIKSNQLGDARRKIDQAIGLNAKKVAPQTLSEADANYKAAENTIGTDRHNANVMAVPVAKANESAEKLLEVTKYATADKHGTSEAVALQMYNQHHVIDRQKSMLQGEAAANAALAANNASLSKQNGRLANGAEFNEVLKNAQAMFTPSEAEVYRVGDQLLVRLKEIQFPTGKATLPDTSTDTLQKVEKVMAMIGTEKVVVEGHTDDVGGKTQNMELSERRAATVANYLVKDSAIAENSIETKGYGYDKPLTSNKTKAGRAQNRRVDIMITPRSVE